MNSVKILRSFVPYCCCCSVSHVRLYDPKDCSTPDCPVLHYLPGFVQTHIRWVHPTISSSVIPFCSCSQSFPASGSFPMVNSHVKWPQYWSFNFCISPSNEHSGLISFRIDWSLCLLSKGLSRVFFSTTIWKHQFFSIPASFMVQLLHPHVTTEETIALTIWTFVSKMMSLFFNTLSRFVIVLLPSSKSLLTSWLQSPSTVILEPSCAL